MGALLGLVFGLGLLLIWRSGPRKPARAQKASTFTMKRTELLRQAGIASVSSAQLLFMQIGAGFLAFLLILLATSTLTIAICFGLMASLAPYAVVVRLRNRRTTELRDVWAEVIDNLASGIRAGLSLPEALSSIGNRGPETLRGPFQQFGADYRAIGRFMECLDRLKDRLADPVADRICETLRIAREVGGTDLGQVLRTLSAFLREDARTRAELEARQSWTVNAARLAVAAPWLILILLGTQTTTLQAYDSPGGTLVLAGGAIVCVFAYRMMVRLGRLPSEGRVLR